MITVLSLNPSVDHAIEVDDFQENGLNRVQLSRKDPGGKGVNVALALSALGKQASVTGFLWKENASLFQNRLISAGVETDFIMKDGSVRTNIKLKSRATGSITEINEPGRPVSVEDLAEVKGKTLLRAKSSHCLILSGSVPPGTPAGFYGAIVKDAREHCFTILDADGEKLALGIESRPHMIKPNRYELETLTGRPLPTLASVRDAARELVARGIEVVLVSLGGEGAVLVTENGAWHAPALRIPVQSTVAAGDSMVAGFAAAFADGKGILDAFRASIAASAAKCMTMGTEPLDHETYSALLPRVEIEEI